MSDYYGGDIVAMSDGRQARVVGSRFRIGPGQEESELRLKFEDGSEEYRYPSEVVALVKVGPHDYWKGAVRGVCRRCGTRKMVHGTTSSERGREGTWATPHPS